MWSKSQEVKSVGFTQKNSFSVSSSAPSRLTCPRVISASKFPAPAAKSDEVPNRRHCLPLRSPGPRPLLWARPISASRLQAPPNPRPLVSRPRPLSSQPRPPFTDLLPGLPLLSPQTAAPLAPPVNFSGRVCLGQSQRSAHSGVRHKEWKSSRVNLNLARGRGGSCPGLRTRWAGPRREASRGSDVIPSRHQKSARARMRGGATADGAGPGRLCAALELCGLRGGVMCCPAYTRQ